MDESLSVQMVCRKNRNLLRIEKCCRFGSRMEKKMKKYDVVALGELLIDFTETERAIREILFLRQTQEEHRVMCLRC